MIGKKEVTITIKYVSDYTNGVGYIDDLEIETHDGGIVEYPTVIGILEMAKYKISELNELEE